MAAFRSQLLSHRCSALALGLLALSACSGATSLDTFDDQCPPPDLGRPWWVRYPARAGAYVGGFLGGIASVALLPVTYPVSLVGSESLGSGKTDFLLFPVYLMAGAGHFTLGAPFDTIHYLGYRAWTDEKPRPTYDTVPPGPGGPGPESRPVDTSAPTNAK